MTTLVQDSGEVYVDGSTTATVSLTGVTAGNLLIALYIVGKFGTLGAVTNSSGYSTAENPAAPDDGANPYGPTNAIFYLEDCGSGSQSCTAVGDTSDSYWMCNLSEWAITGTGNLDVHTTNQSGIGVRVNAGNTGTTGTTAQDDEIAVYAICPGASGGTSSVSDPASSGYTTLAHNVDDSAHVCGSIGYKSLSATGTQIASITWASAIGGGYCGSIATFKVTTEDEEEVEEESYSFVN